MTELSAVTQATELPHLTELARMEGDASTQDSDGLLFAAAVQRHLGILLQGHSSTEVHSQDRVFDPVVAAVDCGMGSG